MRKLTLLALICAAASIAGCGESYEWNQKLTIEVETPDGVKRGSSTVQVEISEGAKLITLPDARRFNVDLMGEATVVELSSEVYLFALLGKSESLARNVFADVLPKDLMKRANELTSLRASRPVPREHYPLLVTFTDINDPMTVKKVDPNNLAASFGEGFRLRSIQLEITDEEITERRVEGVLEWLAGLDGGYLHGRSSSLGSPLGLHGGDFIVMENS